MNNPIVIPMTISSNKVTYNMAVSSTEETYSMSVATKIEYAKIPPNYGLITYDGSIITVS